MSLFQTAAVLGSLAASVSAHGYVQGVVAGGEWYQGYNPSFQYANPAPIVIGWSDPEDLGNGFIPPSNYSTPDIICHLGATPAGTSAKVAAGSVVELQWTDWPESHHGPVIDYLAKCTDSCTDVDKTTLKFFKIDQVGLVDDTTVPGTWGTDQLIANNNSWTVTIPKSIAPGNYVLRHEIIALHSAGTADGAQNYPQCINLEVTSDGTDAPAGTLGEKLYKEDAPGVIVNIYQSLSTYMIPGPTLYSGAVSMKQTQLPFSGAAPVSSGSSSAYAASTAPASTSAVATSAAAATTSAPVKAVTSTPEAYSSAAATSESSAAPFETSAPATTYSAPSATTAAPVETSAPAGYIAPAAISSIAAGIPSSVLTATIPTVLPTGTGGVAAPTGGYGMGNGSLDGMPSKPLPPGYTLKDLLEWVAYLMKQMWKEGGHQRDFRGH